MALRSSLYIMLYHIGPSNFGNNKTCNLQKGWMAWGTAGREFAYNHCETQDNLLEETSKVFKNNARTGINIFQLALDVRNYELKIKMDTYMNTTTSQTNPKWQRSLRLFCRRINQEDAWWLASVWWSVKIGYNSLQNCQNIYYSLLGFEWCYSLSITRFGSVITNFPAHDWCWNGVILSMPMWPNDLQSWV